MLFNSLAFVLFGLVFFSAWTLLRTQRQRLGFLVVASFFFYGYWDWRFLFLLAGSGLIDFFAGLGMQRFPHRRGLLLSLSLLGNVGSLVVFKYFGFLVDNANAILRALGAEPSGAEPLSVVLPVGISFYTFQSMSYTIDIYRGRLQPTRSLVHFFAYLSMFPQLVAGPIVRAAELLPQLQERRTPTAQDRWEGWTLISQGFFKKCVLADNLAPFVTEAYGNVERYQAGGYWWFATTLFAFQIFFDFSGYSNIARGLGRLMGLRFPGNFDHPYVSTSFQEFWARWHISLSTWFRDYVYIPLGGSKTGAIRSHVNVWITMTVSGLWHGAAWTFFIWGAVHALFLSFERLTRWPDRVQRLLGAIGRPVAVLAVFALTLVSWVFFRAESLTDAMVVLNAMFSLSALAQPFDVPAVAVVVLAVALFWEIYAYLNVHHPSTVMPGLRWARPLAPVSLAMLLAASVYLRGPGTDFIYFQF